MIPNTAVWIFPVAGLLIPILFLLALVRFLGHRQRSEAARARVDVQMRLLDKINSSEELRAYLEAGGMRQITDALAPAPSEAYSRIATPASIGAALVVAGLCIIGVAIPVGENWIAGLGVLTLVSGIACLVAAFVSYRLSKAWGLLDRPK